jgi:ATP-dependent DNA helicase RecQ
MGAFSELSRRDIAHILRGLRKAARGNRDPIVITSGEILRDEDVAASIALEDANADTKVRTAISWLERAGFLERDENVTSVFQARPLVRDLAEAETRMAGLNLSISERALWLAILRELMNAGTADSLTVDQLALLPEFVNYARPPTQPQPPDLRLEEHPAAYAERVSHDYVSAKIIRILRNLAQAGLVKRDTLLNAFISYKVPNHSRIRLDLVLATDRKLVDLLATEEPDPEGWMPLCLRLLNQRLCDDGCLSSTELVRQLLRSLSEDGRGFAGSRGSLDLRFVSRDSYRVRLHRSWTALGELAEKRRRVASLILDVLLAKIPGDTPASSDLLVAFSFEELHDAIDRDRPLRSELKDIDVAIERALMYLHEQRIIILQQGLAIFRSAMTIRLQPDSKGQKYTNHHYQPLQHHYRERVFQVHVMSEFARRGLARIREALSLVLAYFSLDKETFIRRFLGTKPELLEHATTAHSFQRIVSDLANPAQVKVVTAPTHRNLLILAGPGSGKTRTVVHRCAYLLRVERVRPQGVLVCCFNRHAAIEVRRRLADLVGHDARGVTVLTYHSLALRLLGRSFTHRARTREAEFDFDALIAEAVKLLRGESVHPGIEPDDVRDRLLSGFQHILVDEYQDIDEPQYELISALAGRTLDDPDLKLAILAVGDDDQNIYAFRGANVQFIRRFQRDYDAEPHYLVENYRSTRYIIEAANQLIGANTDRMKSEHPIRIDRHRDLQHPGGDFGRNEPLTGGRVQIIRVLSESHQASAVIAELQRLKSLANVDWSNVAVLSRTHRELARVRSLAERQHIPVRWWADRNKLPPLHHVREIHRFIQRLAEQRNALVRASDLRSLADELNSRTAPNPWFEYLHRLIDSWQTESDDAELPVQEAIEFLYESCSDDRRDFTFGRGVTLSTIHAAKGTEYDHVLLIGTWPLDPRPASREELRRTFYVGMTRARLSLALFHQPLVPTLDHSPRLEEGIKHLGQPSAQPSLLDSLIGPAFLRNDTDAAPEPDSLPTLDYVVLGLDDIHLGFPAFFRPNHPIHAALANLQSGDLLTLTPDPHGIRLLDSQGTCVARLSRKADEAWRHRLNAIREIRILAMIHRTADQDSDTIRAQNLPVSTWEIPIVEILLASG